MKPATRITVWVKPKSKDERVIVRDDGVFVVHVHEPATENRANNACLKAVAKRLHVPPSSLRIVVGRSSRRKIIEALT